MLVLLGVMLRRLAYDWRGEHHLVLASVGLRDRLDDVVGAANQLDHGGPGGAVPARLPVRVLHPGKGVRHRTVPPEQLINFRLHLASKKSSGFSFRT